MVSIEKEKLEKLKEAFNRYYVKQYAAGVRTKIVVEETKRFDQTGGDLELLELDDSGTVIKSLGCWYWDEIRFCGGEVDFVFEKQREYRSHRMSLSFSCGSDFTLYTDRLKVDEKYPAFSYNVIEDKVEKYCRTNMMQTIREQLAEKILSGELEINVYCSDMDGYDCPPSKIKNQIIEI